MALGDATNVRRSRSRRRKSRRRGLVQAALACAVGIAVAAVLSPAAKQDALRLTMEGPAAPVTAIFPETLSGTVTREPDEDGKLSIISIYLPAGTFLRPGDPIAELSTQFTARAPRLEGRELASRLDRIAALVFDAEEVRCPSYDIGRPERIDGVEARKLTIRLNRGC